MGCIKFKVRRRLGNDFVNNYDLLVIPSFPFIKRLRVGDIKIQSGRPDCVFIKIPYNFHDNSKGLVLDCFRKLMDIISVNEYKKVLIDFIYMPLINECCLYDDKEICHEIYNLINDYVKDGDIEINMVISKIKEKKYYFD